MDKKQNFVMPIILLSTASSLSLWFAGNTVAEHIQVSPAFSPRHVGIITVHIGFIAGALMFACLGLTDRYPARMVFFVCSLLGALFNISIVYACDLMSFIALRALTGVMLAGIYPVGMKICFSWYPRNIGKILGFLLGAFTIGTALPYLLSCLGTYPDWKTTLISISSLSVAGGALVLIFVPDAPHFPEKTLFERTAIAQVFKNKGMRMTAIGYCGHMWELYSFWAFLPLYLSDYFFRNRVAGMSVNAWVFVIVAGGCVGCVLGGLLSERYGNARVAFFQLAISCACCLLSPVFLVADIHITSFILILCVWGMSVIGDSPQFSAIVAKKAKKHLVGTSLTLVNCLGFFISIISLEFINGIRQVVDINYLFLFLVPGPLIGLICFFPMVLHEKND